MEHGALHDTLERGGRVNSAAILHDERGAVVVEIVGEVAAQLVEIELARSHDLGGILILGQREKKMLQGRVLMLPLLGEIHGAFESAFETGGQ